jgi:amidase
MTSILDQDRLNAFTRHTHAEVKGAPTGPLAGLTFGVKDIYDIAGVKTGFGSPVWLETHDAAPKTAPLVQQLLDAGASVVGKTHTEEMAFSINGVNAHYGTPVNVKAEGRVCGGSSSGSAAAVAAGLCDFALGSDTGGSVRLPASYTGLYGLRPTHGRLSLEGVRPLAPGFDTAGWFTRDADLFARTGKVLFGGIDNDPPGELLLAEDAFALLGEKERKALDPALSRISRVLGSPRPVKVSAEGFDKWFEAFRTIQFAEVWQSHGDWVTKYKPQFGPGIHERIYLSAKVTPELFAAARTLREDIAKRMATLLKNRAIIVLPTVPGIAPKPVMSLPEADKLRATSMALLCTSGLARLPQMSLPLASVDGCPFGISIMAAQGGDEMLIAAAEKIAAAAG